MNLTIGLSGLSEIQDKQSGKGLEKIGLVFTVRDPRHEGIPDSSVGRTVVGNYLRYSPRFEAWSGNNK